MQLAVPSVILCGVLVESAMGPPDNEIHKRLVVGSGSCGAKSTE